MSKIRIVKTAVAAAIAVFLLLMCGAVYKMRNHEETEYYSKSGKNRCLVYADGVYVCAPLGVARSVTISIKRGSTCVIDGYKDFTVKRNKIYTLGESGVVEEAYSKERLDRILDTL